jgi:hypothetical protein
MLGSRTNIALGRERSYSRSRDLIVVVVLYRSSGWFCDVMSRAGDPDDFVLDVTLRQVVLVSFECQVTAHNEDTRQ